MRLVMPLNDGDDVLDAEAVRAEEIVHRITGGALLQEVNLLPHPAVGVGGAVVARILTPRKGDVVAPAFDVDNAVVRFGESAVVETDVTDGSRIPQIDEVPIVLVIVALRSLIPFPHLVELEIP